MIASYRMTVASPRSSAGARGVLLGSVLVLPYRFWGLVCGTFSVAVLVYGTIAYWGREPRTPQTLPAPAEPYG